MNSDFYPHGITPIDTIRTIYVDYTVSDELPQVVLSFPEDLKGMSTVFGSSESSSIVLRDRDILKLPHNLVQCCLTNVAESEEIGGLTPDIVLHTENGIDIIEIATRKTMDDQELASAISMKASKYFRLIAMGLVRRIQVIAVGLKQVMCINGVLDHPNSIALRAAYRLGVEIQNKFEGKWGLFPAHDSDDRHSKCLDSFLSLPIERMPGGLDPRSLTSELKESTSVRVGRETYDKEVKTWAWFITEHSQESHIIDHSKTVIHLPMILTTDASSELFISDRSDVYDRLVANISRLKIQSSRDFETLRAVSEHNQGAPKKMLWHELEDDEFRISLSLKELIHLARRGVMKKSLSSMGIPEIMAVEKDSKRDIHFDTSTADIDDWIQDRELVSLSDSLKDWVELMSWKTVAGKCAFIEAISDVGKLSLFHQLKNLELIVREVAYNMARNPKDLGSHKHFICKKLLNIDAYIIIRTTRMAGTEDSPCHFFVVYHGPPNHGNIFEKTYEMGGSWYRTDFISLNRRKLEHLQGILAQSISLLGLFIEQLEQGIHPWSMSKVKNVFPAFKTALLILLEDKDNTSQNLQQLRYYYMQLFSGTPGSKILSQKVISKLTSNIRTRLMLYLYKRLIAIHDQLPEVITRLEAYSDPNREAHPDLDYETEILMMPIPTPFNFYIAGPDEMLLASYMCMLHNKNEMNYGHGSVQMMEKVCKRQYQRADFCDRDDDYDIFSLTGDWNPDDLREFQHHRDSIVTASRLFKTKVCKIQGWDVKSWDKLAEREILSFILRTTLEDMATTKSTTIPYDSDLTITLDGLLEKGLSRRTKCLEQMLNLVDEMEDNLLALNVETILSGIKEKEENRIQVSLFKKNQIGGVREIYVLTMRGRLLIRVFSDLFRALCSLHPSEKLTNDKTKDSFVGEHFARVKSEKAQGYSTAKISGDMTNWAQLFSLYEFMDMSRAVLPKCFHNFAFWVLSLHRRKTLQLPEKLLEMFMVNPNSDLSTESVNRLKKGFYSDNDPLIKKHGTCIFSKSDMMQGILHFPSSLYHILHLEFLSAVLRSTAPNGLKAKISFEVSSDDEGILVSYLGEKQPCQRAILSLQKNWSRIKHSIDKLFGVRTSFEKSTFSTTELFEFNSKFYVGNSISSPLIKFVARACDDNPQESITRRVASIYSQLRQLRENGASGYLCEWVSCCQSLSFDMNLGLMTMPWMSPNKFKELLQERITPIGFLAITPAIIAGLTDGVFSNWIACKDSASATKLMYYLGNYGAPVDSDDLDTALYTMYPIRKYHAMKSRVGLEGVERSKFLDKDKLMRLMIPSKTLSDSKLKMQYQMLDPSIAASLSWLSRTDTTRLSPYFAYSAMFRDRSIDYKMSLLGLKESILSNKKDKDIPLEYLFPMQRQFMLIELYLNKELIEVKLQRRRRLKYQWIDSSYTVGEHIQELKTVLNEIWWQQVSKTLSREQIKSFWTLIKRDIPFMMDTPEQTLDCSPFDTYSQLLGFIESTSGSVKPVKLLARGYTNKSGMGMEVLFRTNLSPYSIFHIKDEAALSSQSEQLRSESMIAPLISPILSYQVTKLEDFCKAWYEILYNVPDPKKYYDLFINSMRDRFSELVKPDVRSSKTRSETLDSFLLRVKLMIGDIDLSVFAREVRQFTVWVVPDNFRNQRYDINGEFIRKRNGIFVHAKPWNSGAKVICDGDEFQARNMIKDRVIKLFSRGPVLIPRLKASHIEDFKGQRLLALKSDERKGFWYMSLPDARPGFEHWDRLDGSLLSGWLSRSKMTMADKSSLIKGVSENDPIALSVASICKRILKAKTTLRISERLGTRPQVKDETTEEDYLKILDELPEATEEDWEGQIFDSFMNQEEDSLYGNLMGLESFSIESSLTAIELNPFLRDCLALIAATQMLPEEFHTSDVTRFIRFLSLD